MDRPAVAIELLTIEQTGSSCYASLTTSATNTPWWFLYPRKQGEDVQCREISSRDSPRAAATILPQIDESTLDVDEQGIRHLFIRIAVFQYIHV
jgi:hypothetical protein